jgi:hypothetical protein
VVRMTHVPEITLACRVSVDVHVLRIPTIPKFSAPFPRSLELLGRIHYPAIVLGPSAE